MNRVSKEDVVEETSGGLDRITGEQRDVLEAADIDPAKVVNKEYSYRMLLAAGVDEDVADALRRQLSLSWSFETDGDLDSRSDAIRGLGEAEREWVAASADDSWQAFEAAREVVDEADDADDERPYPRPTPVTAVVGVSEENAAVLAEAGIISAERLATIDATTVARVLELSVLHVRTWRHSARQVVEARRHLEE